jgi:hypothetical protein
MPLAQEEAFNAGSLNRALELYSQGAELMAVRRCVVSSVSDYQGSGKAVIGQQICKRRRLRRIWLSG